MRRRAEITVHETKTHLSPLGWSCCWFCREIKIRIWTELCSLPGLELPREGKGKGHPPLAGGSSFCPESTVLCPPLLLSSPGCSHVNCDNHVNSVQLFNAAVLIAGAGDPCFSIVYWVFGLTLFAPTCWKWIRPLELDFATVDRTASFIIASVLFDRK